MERVLPRPARIAAGLIALAGFATLALQSTLNLETDGSVVIAFAHMLRFFTIWTNFAGALVFASIAMGRVHSSRVMLALAAAYVVVALVYHVLLSPTHHPVGLDWWTNLMLHSLLPAAALAWWFAFAPVPAWRCVPHVMWAPVIYTGFALVVGATTGFYPYFFLDQPTLGWPVFFAYLAGLAAFFMLVATGLKVLRIRAAPTTLPA